MLHAEPSILNFFLVFESVLLGVVGALYGKPTSAILVLRVVVVLGLSITVIWMLVQARHKLMFDAISEEVAERMPEYVVAWKRINEKLEGFFRSVSRSIPFNICCSLTGSTRMDLPSDLFVNIYKE